MIGLMLPVLLVLQLLLGLVFAISTLGKLRRPAAFIRGVEDYEILPRVLAPIAGALLIPVEAFLAVSHLTGWALGAAAPLGLVTLGVFLTAVSVNLARRRDLLCHCFDSAYGERISMRSVVQLVLLLVAEAGVAGWAVRGSLTDRVASGADLLHALLWAVFVLLVGLWLLRADEMVRLVRRHRCKTCSADRNQPPELSWNAEVS